MFEIVLYNTLSMLANMSRLFQMSFYYEAIYLIV